MKRIISVIAALLAVLLVFAGCSVNKGGETPVTVTETATVAEFTEPAKPEYTQEELDKMVAFTFDDGPGTDTTNRILDQLEKYGFTATFFVIGRNITDSNASVMRRAVTLGCEIGNHTQNHNTNLNNLSMEKVTQEIEATSDAVEKATGKRPTLMRPPGGAFSHLKGKLDYAIIHWCVDTNDWRKKGSAGNAQAARNLADYIIGQVEGNGGAIVLMHDIYDFTAETMEIVIPELAQMGYRICSVSDLAQAYGEKLEPGQVYFRINRMTSLEPGRYVVNTRESPLTLRAEPEPDAEVLLRLAKGTEITVEKCENGWAKTSYRGTSGWVNADYLKKAE
ncbi:MAG: polysaccharide deacetylase family protein [Clostridia bacterium]|nr:polysaccharide deacetylase family protein [Clostridia bacterium]